MAEELAEPAPPPPPRSRGRGVFAWILAAIAFVLGLGAGAVTVALLTGEPSRIPATVTTTVSAPPTDAGAATGTESSGVTAQITVNDACIRALNAAQDAYAAIAELGDAAREFDVARLDDIVRRLQPLQASLESDIAACNVTARLPSTAPGTTAPATTATATTAPPTTGTPATG